VVEFGRHLLGNLGFQTPSQLRFKLAAKSGLKCKQLLSQVLKDLLFDRIEYMAHIVDDGLSIVLKARTKIDQLSLHSRDLRGNLVVQDLAELVVVVTFIFHESLSPSLVANRSCFQYDAKKLCLSYLGLSTSNCLWLKAFWALFSMVFTGSLRSRMDLFFSDLHLSNGNLESFL